MFNKLDNKQFALYGRSTTQALIFFMHTILEILDTCGRYIRIFFSDFSKGFDLVDHNILLSELNNSDVDPYVVRWIAAFLTNRSQRVRIGNSLSPPIGLNCWTVFSKMEWPLSARAESSMTMLLLPWKASLGARHLTLHLKYLITIHMLP